MSDLSPAARPAPPPPAPDWPAPDWYEAVPRSIRTHVIVALVLLTVSFGGFGAWAFRAPLAAAVIAPGGFVATGNNKIIQHLEGGIIDQIYAAEGDVVEAGAPLVRLETTAAAATEQEMFLRLARLEAIAARLEAEHALAPDMAVPAFLAEHRDNPEVARMLDEQRTNFAVSRAKLAADIALFQRNIRAYTLRVAGREAQLAALDEQIAILNEDHADRQVLFEKGLMRKPEVNTLRRALAEGRGDRARLAAEIAETGALIAKLREEIGQVRTAYRQAALDELQLIHGEREAVREKLRSAQSVLRRAVIAAPVAGIVVRLHYNTPGGVIESGKPILEILPADAPLIIELQVPRTDIDAVRVGQEAMVRLTALNQRTTPVLDGEVTYVSADAIPDMSDQMRRDVYVARVGLPRAELDRVPGFAPTPGMPVTVMIQTAERTFFEYLARPIVDSMSRAFREH